MAENATRLRLTRNALGYTQQTMSRLMGSTTDGQAWENYESGRRLISVAHALALCRSCGLTLDWIYRGSIANLPHDLAEKIRRQIARERPTERRPKNPART